MKTKNLLTILLTAAISLSSVTAFAQVREEPDRIKDGVSYYLANEDSITPRFTYFTECTVGLTNMGNGKLKCVGGTTVRNGYTTSTIMELQQLVGGTWTTIKTWSGSGGTNSSLEEYRYVDSGAYQVKVSHIAMNGNASVETFTSYSKIVIL